MFNYFPSNQIENPICTCITMITNCMGTSLLSAFDPSLKPTYDSQSVSRAWFSVPCSQLLVTRFCTRAKLKVGMERKFWDGSPDNN